MSDQKHFIDLLKQLVSIPSSSQNEWDCILVLTALLKKELGMDIVLQNVSERSANLIGIRKGKGKSSAKKKLMLGGHLDTVSPALGWNTDPYALTIQGEKAYGLGAADMKGGLAAQITVLKRLLDEGKTFDGDIEMAIFCDEERHSAGANKYVEQARNNGDAMADFAIFAEPHYDNIVVGATGKVLLGLSVKGKAGHAANPETGVNAIDCMAQFLSAVNKKYGELYQKGKGASHCALRIESKYGGYSLNIPEECSVLLNKQLYVWEKEEEVISDLQLIYQREVGEGSLTISREVPYYPSYELDQSNDSFQALLALLKNKYNLEPELRLNQSVSDGNILYTQLGIPIVLFGPAGYNYHKPNEYLDLPSAYNYMNILYDFIIDYMAF